MVPGKRVMCERIKFKHFFISYKTNKNGLKTDGRPEILKLLKENIGRILFDTNHSNIFGGLSSKVKETKAKNKQIGHN